MMIILLLIFIFLISLFQTSTMPAHPQEIHKFYPYNNYFFDLEKMERNKIGGKNIDNENSDYVFLYENKYKDITVFSKKTGEKVKSFKVEGTNRPGIYDNYLISSDDKNIYIYDFQGNKLSFVPARIHIKDDKYFYSQMVIYRDKIFLTTPCNGLKIKELKGTKEISLKNEEANIKQDINGRNLLLYTETGVVYIKDLEGKDGIVLYKYDENGKELFKSKIEHTDIEVKGNTNYHHRYLNYFTSSKDSLIFTTNVFETKYNTTQIVDLTSGKVTKASLITSGIITDDRGNLSGLMSLNEDTGIFSLYSKDGKTKKLEYKFPSKIWCESTEVVVYENILVLAYYCRISTGSSLIALDINTGKLLWTGDVLQLMIPHSEYYNEVKLSLYKDKVIMHGIESGGTYLQIFDVKSGKRLFDDMNKSW